MSKWDAKITKAEKFLERSREHGRAVYDRYKDKREGADGAAGVKKANLFYSNVNTLKESLYNSLPKADVKQIHKGNYNDDVSRVACIGANRVLDYETECAPDFDEAMKLAILDRLVPGIGQVWCGFDADMDESENIIPGSEHIKVEHVHWCDFIYEPAKRWSKVTWVGRKLHLDREDFEDQFGEEALQRVGSPRGTSDETGGFRPEDVNKDKICVYEIWDKRKKEVHFIYKGLEEPLKTVSDPLKLAKFFPCPRPLIANVNSDEFLPVTDYHIAQDQYRQLDTLYARMSLIIDAIKVAGLYDSSNTAIARMLTEGQNSLIPVDNWAMHAERGGAKGQIDWYPVEVVATVLKELQIQFEAIKGLLAEISGMSDIVRGDSNQYETAKAQQIKAQFASVRLNGYQRDVAVFVRDVMRIMADIAFGLYSDEKLAIVVGKLEEPDMQYAQEALAILRNDMMTKYKVNIQADSLTQEDWALEKGQRQEIVSTLGNMLGQVVPMVEQLPQMAMLATQMVKFAISGFKGSAELEGWIDQQLDMMTREAIQKAQNPQPPKPSPEEQKAQGEMQKLQMEAQIKQQEAAQNQQSEQQKLALEQQRMEMEMAHQQQMDAMEIRMKEMELQFKEREFGLQMQMKQREAVMGLQTKAATNEMGIQNAQQKNELAMEQAENKPKPKKGE